MGEAGSCPASERDAVLPFPGARTGVVGSKYKHMVIPGTSRMTLQLEKFRAFWVLELAMLLSTKGADRPKNPVPAAWRSSQRPLYAHKPRQKVG